MAYTQKGDNPITRKKKEVKVLPIDDVSNYEYDYDQNEDITTAPKAPKKFIGLLLIFLYLCLHYK